LIIFSLSLIKTDVKFRITKNINKLKTINNPSFWDKREKTDAHEMHERTLKNFSSDYTDYPEQELMPAN